MLDLFDRIEAGLKTEFEGKQLSCISKLVFYCGVQAKEIPELRIRDVIGKGGEIIRKIKVKGARDINLNGAAFERSEIHCRPSPKKTVIDAKTGAIVSRLSEYRQIKTGLETVRNQLPNYQRGGVCSLS